MTSMEAHFGDAARTVPLPKPWNLNAYLADVAAHRGRSIALRPVSAELLAEKGCRGKGLWVARAYDDIIVYDADATDRNAEHIILHEIGHMLLGHDHFDEEPEQTALAPSLAALLPSLGSRQVFGRTEFGADREQEAEVFADMTMVYATLPGKRGRGFRLFGRGSR
ncbi:hypothetical protein [Nocardia bovistercoris]|uniref:IrrE N-terminal-like domain-containing protein n=1 Tax=Nocardia bovistercoris TaxID=2785916 RepID=A0A931N155_9NOCA|nr:hypothetical protein [Nocardia bovistercoris]MBH0775342.1 hypothetical protein [Nocardia bovistercoris]